jgi:hypothetical protein
MVVTVRRTRSPCTAADSYLIRGTLQNALQNHGLVVAITVAGTGQGAPLFKTTARVVRWPKVV